MKLRKSFSPGRIATGLVALVMAAVAAGCGASSPPPALIPPTPSSAPPSVPIPLASPPDPSEVVKIGRGGGVGERAVAATGLTRIVSASFGAAETSGYTDEGCIAQRAPVGTWRLDTDYHFCLQQLAEVEAKGQPVYVALPAGPDQENASGVDLRTIPVADQAVPPAFYIGTENEWVVLYDPVHDRGFAVPVGAPYNLLQLQNVRVLTAQGAPLLDDTEELETVSNAYRAYAEFFTPR